MNVGEVFMTLTSSLDIVKAGPDTGSHFGQRSTGDIRFASILSEEKNWWILNFDDTRRKRRVFKLKRNVELCTVHLRRSL